MTNKIKLTEKSLLTLVLAPWVLMGGLIIFLVIIVSGNPHLLEIIRDFLVL